MASLDHDTVYFLPNAFAKSQAATVAAADLLFVDLNYVMATRLCRGGAIRKLHPDAIRALRPRDMPIACALSGATADAHEMIQLLNAIGYRGHLTIVRPSVSAPELIRAELTDLAKGFRLRMIRDHWLGGSAPQWSPSNGAQSLRKALGIRAIPRR